MQGEREETCTISGEGLKWRATETNLRASGCLGQQAPEYWLQKGEKGLCVAMETLKLMKLCIKVGEIYVSKLWFGKT